MTVNSLRKNIISGKTGSKKWTSIGRKLIKTPTPSMMISPKIQNLKIKNQKNSIQNSKIKMMISWKLKQIRIFSVPILGNPSLTQWNKRLNGNKNSLSIIGQSKELTNFYSKAQRTTWNNTIHFPHSQVRKFNSTLTPWTIHRWQKTRENTRVPMGVQRSDKLNTSLALKKLSNLRTGKKVTGRPVWLKTRQAKTKWSELFNLFLLIYDFLSSIHLSF